MWQKYLALWRELTGWRLFLFYTLHYTALFALLWHFLFAAFNNAGKTYIWTEDGMPLYFTEMIYLSQTIRDGIQSLLNGGGWTFPLYDFRTGPVKSAVLGGEAITWLAIFWPWNRIDVLYDALVVARYYLVGLSFSVFGFFFKQKPVPVLVGAVSYTFCGFALYAGVKHPSFLAPMILLPLLIIGVEKVLCKGHPFLLIFLVWLAIITNLYFACMLAILVGLYALIRFPSLYEQDRLREFGLMAGRMAASGGVGILLASTAMLPTLLQMVATGRIGRDASVYADMFHYSKAYYGSFLNSFLLVPGEIADWTWTCLGFSVLSVPTILLLFINRQKETRSLRWLFLALTAMLFIPAVAYVMSGFNSFSNRWCFAYAFCVAAILMFELPHLVTADRQTLIKLTIGTLVYFLICYFIIDHSYYVEAPFALLAASMTIIIACNMLEKRTAAMLLSVCMVLTCVSTYYSAFLMYAPDQRNFVSSFTSKGNPYKRLSQSQYASFAKSRVGESDASFYRVTGNSISRQSVNASFYYGINGLTYYSSSKYMDFDDWYKELELTYLGPMHLNYGLLSRSHMLTLANVKYYVLRKNGIEVIPYGFQKVGRVKNGTETDVILENMFALPVGYTYETYLTREKYDDLSALEKQEAQLQAVVLDQKPTQTEMQEALLDTTAEQIPVSISDMQNITWENEVLVVDGADATITLAFQGVPATETYLRIVNFSGSSGGNPTITAATEVTKAQARFDMDSYLYANGVKTQLLDLGYTEEGYTTCTVNFPQAGTYTLDDLQVWCQPMDRYEDQVNALRKEVLENVETNWRGLTGDISVSRDKVLCFTIPYDSGWSAYVDGEKVDLLRANTAFMAVELEAGNHHVELKYWTPGLTDGIVLTAVGLASLVRLITDWYRKTRTGKSLMNTAEPRG